MPIPGNEEQPGALSRQQQQQQSYNFSSAIPIKKRRFPIIQPASPPREEITCKSEKNKRGSNIPDEKLSISAASITNSPGNSSDVSKNCATVVQKEEVTPRNIKLVQANVEPSSSEPQEAKPCVSLGPNDDLKNKVDILLNETLPESKVQGNSMASCVMNVKQEIPSGKTELSMNVKLSVGPKKPLIPALEQQNSEYIGDKSDKSDPSLLSLSLSTEKPVLHGNTVDNISSGARSNRSNWDLNRTMDAWESSIDSDAFAHRFVDNVKSSLTTAGTINLCLNKGKGILDERRTNSNTPVKQFQQGKIDDSVGLTLGMPYNDLDFIRKSSVLSNKLTSAGPNLNLQHVQLSAMNLTIANGRTVKSEPVDENSKCDSSIGSKSSSSNMGLSKCSSMKRELVEKYSDETLFSSSVGPDKLFDRRSIKSALALPQAIGSVFHHQESCASSSALSMPSVSVPQNSCRSKLSVCSELSTSGDLSSQSEHSFHSKEVHDHNDIPDGLTAMVSKPVSQDVGNLNVEDPEKCEIGKMAEHSLGLCEQRERASNDEEWINRSAEIIKEDFYGSDFEYHENSPVNNSLDVRKKISHKEDEYEDGEIRESLLSSLGEDPIDKGKKIQNVEERECDSTSMQPCITLGDQDAHASELDGKVPVSENHSETQSDRVEESVMIDCEPHSEDKSLQDLPEEVSEVGVDDKRCISVITPEKQLDLSGIEDVEEGWGEEVSIDKPTNGTDEATDIVVKEICSENNDLTSNNVEVSVNGGDDAAKDSNNVGNKSRIINLSRASVVTTPCKTKPVANRLLTSRSGKERCSGPDGEIQPRGYRDEVHSSGLNKYVNDRDYDHSFRRQSFTRERGRGSGRFVSSRNEWDSKHDFASENYNGPSDYRPVRRKHASSISDVDRECNGYYGTSFGSNRRKAIMNDEFSLTHISFRRLSPGDRDGPVNRGNQMLHRIPRNISPSRCDVEDNSNSLGFRHGDKFMRYLSDDMIDPAYARPQAIYDEVDEGQPVHGNRNFSTMQKKFNPRIRSKSPIQRRRSSSGLPELNQNRSPAMYRTGRMKSPDRACFRDEMTVKRRGGSPSFVSRHPNDLRDIESHHRSSNSNRRSFSPPPRVFQRNSRRANALDSREIGDGNGYFDGPPLTNKFRGEGSIDDRRKYIDRQRPVRSFRTSYDGDGDSFHFHSDDGGPRPYRFCPDVDREFVDRSDMREREFEGRIKHQPLVVSRRIRNIEDQHDGNGNGNYRPGGRVWHDDGFSDVSRGKRRRF